jgi:hypothetical protein
VATAQKQNIPQVVQALNSLYVLHRYKYVEQLPSGKYNTHTVHKDKKFPLMLVDSLIENHVNGKNTYGVFADVHGYTPFMFFDFDFKDNWTECKWYYYRVRQALIECGIPAENIHVTDSGNKGLHLELFFTAPVHYKTAQQLYYYALHVAELTEMADKIEFRPTDKQGAKMPLGINQVTKRKCLFLSPDNVENVLPIEYAYNVAKLDTALLNSVLERLVDTYGSVEQYKPKSKRATVTTPAKRKKVLDEQEVIEKATEQFISRTKALNIYGVGEDEEVTADYYNNLLQNGIRVKGSRDNDTFMLAIYLKSYYGMSLKDVKDTLTEWILKQPQSMYDTPHDQVVAKTVEKVEKVFKYDYALTFAQRELTISVAELQTILTAKKADGKNFTPKQKTVLFAMLMHSKRYATTEGTFYMTYDQLTQATGISNRRILKQTIDMLTEVGLVAVHRGNAKQEGTFKKLPNIYEVLFAEAKGVENENTATNSVEDGTSSTATNNGISTVTDITAEAFTTLVNEHFTPKQLRKLLPKEQAKTFIA